jgi:hypothetical protein
MFILNHNGEVVSWAWGREGLRRVMTKYYAVGKKFARMLRSGIMPAQNPWGDGRPEGRVETVLLRGIVIGSAGSKRWARGGSRNGLNSNRSTIAMARF